MKSQTGKHLVDDKILQDTQHKFRNDQTNLLEFLEYVTGYVDKGESVNKMYFDFSKAINKIHYKWLIYKLFSVL